MQVRGQPAEDLGDALCMGVVVLVAVPLVVFLGVRSVPR
jgi:hypothetical protein